MRRVAQLPLDRVERVDARRGEAAAVAEVAQCRSRGRPPSSTSWRSPCAGRPSPSSAPRSEQPGQDHEGADDDEHDEPDRGGVVGREAGSPVAGGAPAGRSLDSGGRSAQAGGLGGRLSGRAWRSAPAARPGSAAWWASSTVAWSSRAARSSPTLARAAFCVRLVIASPSAVKVGRELPTLAGICPWAPRSVPVSLDLQGRSLPLSTVLENSARRRRCGRVAGAARQSAASASTSESGIDGRPASHRDGDRLGGPNRGSVRVVDQSRRPRRLRCGGAHPPDAPDGNRPRAATARVRMAFKPLRSRWPCWPPWALQRVRSSCRVQDDWLAYSANAASDRRC